MLPRADMESAPTDREATLYVGANIVRPYNLGFTFPLPGGRF